MVRKPDSEPTTSPPPPARGSGKTFFCIKWMGLVAPNQTVTNAAKDKKLKDSKLLAGIRDLTEYQAMVKSLNSTIPSGWKSSGEGERGRGKGGDEEEGK
ncbi:hypothetical protein TrVE_jg2080 [Triparma verrucosa]|uniref:Uncharacterized protein n=1 Tax=Triparma verrucosa TaxID=1606542 RepID=A0A9W7C660_9STRA|nr:hypothetical protein TrVE_jg2080 [Triparma verrucosa]